MTRDPAVTERQRALLAHITSQTTDGTLRWERQLHSAHRYARYNNHLLILGPDASLSDDRTPRYLSITPLDSPNWLEITSDDPQLSDALLALIYAVEAATVNQPPTDPFAVTDELLRNLTG